MKQLFKIMLSVLFFALILVSCSKDNSSNLNDKSSINIENPAMGETYSKVGNLKIGEMHNKLLTDFYANNPNFDSEKNTIGEVILEMESIFDLNYPNLKDQYPTIDIKSFYVDSEDKCSDFDLGIHIDQLGQQMVNEGKFNEDLLSFLKDVANEKPTYNEMLSNLDAFKNEHATQIENDEDFKRSVEVLEEIAFYSNSYWDNNDSSTTNKIDRCEQQGYIAEIATGALLFWNPIGSIIGGAAASLIASENCQDGNP